MKTTLNDIGKLLKSDEKSTDKHYYGVVQSINYITVEGKQVADSYNVSLGGTTDTVKCRKLAGAKVGDTVLVTLLSTGTGIVTNTVGGDTDATDALTTANEAQETADEAQEAAESAIVSANGKTKNYYQSSQPTGGTYTVGDTWFDTDDDNKMYEWNGSSWVAITFGENAITDDSISTTKIKDAAISNAKIANLDAGKITTGTINANRIGATSITIGKLGTDVTTTINAKANSADLSSVATSGSYDDLTGSPTNLSDFTNDENYQTASQVSTTVNNHHDSTKANTSDLSDVALSGDYSDLSGSPTKVSDFTNDSGFQTATQVSTTVNNHHDSTKYDASNPNGYTDDTAADAAQETADAAQDAADEAKKTATSYLTTISGADGICVHDENDVYNFANLNSDGMFIYKGITSGSTTTATQKAMFGEQITLFGDKTNLNINDVSIGLTDKTTGASYFSAGKPTISAITTSESILMTVANGSTYNVKLSNAYSSISSVTTTTVGRGTHTTTSATNIVFASPSTLRFTAQAAGSLVKITGTLQENYTAVKSNGSLEVNNLVIGSDTYTSHILWNSAPITAYGYINAANTFQTDNSSYTLYPATYNGASTTSLTHSECGFTYGRATVRVPKTATDDTDYRSVTSSYFTIPTGVTMVEVSAICNVDKNGYTSAERMVLYVGVAATASTVASRYTVAGVNSPTNDASDTLSGSTLLPVTAGNLIYPIVYRPAAATKNKVTLCRFSVRVVG